MALSWIERWFCCGRVDDQEVISLVRSVRANPDALAESYIEYTHDAIEHHVASDTRRALWIDNEELVWRHAHETTATAVPEASPEPGCSPEGSGVSPTPMPAAPVGAPRVGDVVLFGDVPVVVEADVLRMVLPDKAVEALEAHQPDTCSKCNSSENASIPVGEASSVYRVCQDVVEVKRHRRLPHYHKGDYAASVVSEIKNRLGCPAPNAANLLAVRRMAINSCNQHGLRPSHVRQVVERIVAGVFIPDEEDLNGAKMLQSVATAELRDELADAGPRSAWYDLFHPFKRRGAARVRVGV